MLVVVKESTKQPDVDQAGGGIDGLGVGHGTLDPALSDVDLISRVVG